MMNLLDYPDCVLEGVLSFLTYDEIAKTRLVCRKFNETNRQILNHGFFKLLNHHQKQMKGIKSQLPRRESERRNHPLSKHSDVLTCIETRLSMLSMTYQKHIQNGTACFIPGKIIDECYRIMKVINTCEVKTLRAHEILQELRDISSMAIEHFDEKIVPEIRKSSSSRESLSNVCGVFDMFPRSSIDGLLSLSRNSSCSSMSAQSTPMKSTMPRIKAKSKISSLINMYKKQSKVIKSQSKQIIKMVKGLKEQKASLNSLKRRLDDSEAKNLELSESVKKFKEKPVGDKDRKST